MNQKQERELEKVFLQEGIRLGQRPIVVEASIGEWVMAIVAIQKQLDRQETTWQERLWLLQAAGDILDAVGQHSSDLAAVLNEIFEGQLDP